MPSPSSPLCISTLGTPDHTWNQVLTLAHSHQLAAVEIRCLEGQVLEPALFGSLLPAPSQARIDLADHDLRLGMLGTSAKLLVRTEGELDDLCRFADLADQLGTPWLRIFDGGDQSTDRPPAGMISSAARFLEDWAQLKQRHGYRCDLAVETHDAMANLDNARHVIETLPHFKVLWDTHHTWRYGESLSAYHDLIRDRVVHFHVKDSIDRPSRRKPFTYVKPGHGEFPWPELKGILSDAPPNALCSFEWEKHWNPELPEIQEVLPSFLEVMRSA